MQSIKKNIIKENIIWIQSIVGHKLEIQKIKKIKYCHIALDFIKMFQIWLQQSQ